MFRKEMPKEPSRNFFRLFIIIFVLNIIFSVIVYVVSPEQVPSRLTPKGFEDYRSKIYVLFPILLQLIFLLMALIFYKIMPIIPFQLKLYPKFYQKFIQKYFVLIIGKLFLGINPEGLDIIVLVSKYISAFILTASSLLVSFNLIQLGFAFKVANLDTYLIIYFISVLILIIPTFRFFSKRLQ